MTYEVFRGIVYLVGVPIIAWLCVRAIRQVRAIRALDAQLREEEAQAAADPYAQMARLYETKELLERARRGR